MLLRDLACGASTPSARDRIGPEESPSMTVPEGQRVVGVSPIKPEFLLKESNKPLGKRAFSEEEAHRPEGAPENLAIINENSPERESQTAKEDQAKGPLRGQHRNRTKANRIPSSCNVKKDGLCPALARSETCHRGVECRFDHNLEAFLASRPADIGDQCPLISLSGRCKFGLLCRFGSSHPPPPVSAEASGAVEADRLVATLDRFRRKEFTFSGTTLYLKSLRQSDDSGNNSTSLVEESLGPCPPAMPRSSALLNDKEGKRLLDFRGKLYLAPLTTVGNLPFRRICKEYGVDITCGEMAMCTNILKGQASEWALLRRHESEDFFGVQLCGGWTDSMTQCAELLNNHIDCDFVDVNMGCPIDLVFRKGMGSGLMDKTNRVKQIVGGMRSVLKDKLFTVKMRIGIEDGKPLAQKLLPELASLGIDALTIHGRTRQQRYTKEADWSYISSLVEVAKPSGLPIIGNGDILSWEDYEAHKTLSGANSMMVARGALIKPWVFTEIKERRYWDIRSSERLEMLRKYVRYGLEHFGSDTAGVERTRRFLLEWLSFLCRYVPVGILEELPPRMNDRPPAFMGRDDLETLMASPAVKDWIKLSEMLLGPVADDFVFLPKHKSNSYEQPLSQSFA